MPFFFLFLDKYNEIFLYCVNEQKEWGVYMYVPSGLDKAVQILNDSTKFLVYYDTDIDGAVAGELVRRILDKYKKYYRIYINENRQHGLKLTDTQLKKLEGFTIILVDAGVTREEVEKCVNLGVSIIVIDHHEVHEDKLIYVENEKTKAKGVIINNQYVFEPKEYRFLSGAGVVYYVLKNLFPHDIGVEEEFLVGISLLSDVREIENSRARYFLEKTYSYRSDYVNYLIDLTKPLKDYSFGEYVFDRNFIDYYFNTSVNALFRLNKGYDAIDVFSRKYNGSSLVVFKENQMVIRDKMLERTKITEFSNYVVAVLDYNSLGVDGGYDITNFVGLVCSRLRSQYGKTVLYVVQDNGVIKRGSVRGKKDGVDYLKIFKDNGFIADGHKIAFGVTGLYKSIDFNKINQDIEKEEQTVIETKKVLEVTNLSFMLHNGVIEKIAYENNFVRSEKRTVLKYIGSEVTVQDFPKLTKYIIDGVEILCFNKDLDITKGYIVPLIEKGKYLKFYLTE